MFRIRFRLRLRFRFCELLLDSVYSLFISSWCSHLDNTPGSSEAGEVVDQCSLSSLFLNEFVVVDSMIYFGSWFDKFFIPSVPVVYMQLLQAYILFINAYSDNHQTAGFTET